MATNERPARLALTAAVVVLLLGAAGVLARQQFSGTAKADAGAGVAGIEVVAPAGTRFSMRPAPEPDVAAPLTRRIGGGADLSFDGRPPQVRIPVPAAPPPGFAPVVVTGNGTRLIPATYDGATRSLVAEVARPGGFWGGLLDLAALGRDTEAAPKPDCAGRAASSGGMTVDVGTPDPRAPVWVCVTAGNGRANITLTSNSRVPYRIVGPPGWPEPGTRTAAAGTAAAVRLGRPRQRELLWPGAGVTYDVAFGELPATLRGQADPGPAVGTALATAAHRAAVLFGLAGGTGPAAGVLTCAADAGAARYTADRPFAEVAAEVWTALEPCHPDGGDVVRRLIAAGIGPVTSSFSGASPTFEVPVTTSRAQRFTQTVDYRPRAATARAAGTCPAVSAVSGRHDAYRCTAGGTTHDPCFAGAGTRPQVWCPTSATEAVLLTYSGTLPSPPQAGGTTGPFLLVLENGLQCTAVAAPDVRYTCSDGRTVLHGEPDTSSPMWTIEARTIAKAYA
ncbi:MULTISPECIES: hypothetical protein [unclassified Amycolatopsis]|uniref:hypothetical protein n=1 Tax=unclassified Amycolatopsis TaxID=2618356 RepID=UPI0028740F48|nr:MULTISPECIES: hypothetical protein [unclassified Amycolatopsis]MDS0138937.1 hypothetical protein [Amycolatopsis sp. 505]MDS0147609.1 hypothetical protein [Amycolatopsis sp. CM201R]